MKTILVGRDNELRLLDSSLSANGHLRAGLIKGAHGMGKTALLEEVEQNLLGREKDHLFFSPKANDFSDQLTFCTSLVRSARSGLGIRHAALNNFARNWGSQVMQLAKDTRGTSDESTSGSGLAEAWLKLLEDSLEEQEIDHQSITPVLILDDLDLYGNETIDWLTGPFNQTIRKSKLFKRTRFLFSAKETRN